MPFPPLPPELRALPRRRLRDRPAQETSPGEAASPSASPPAAGPAPRPSAAAPAQARGELPPIERLPRGGPLPASSYQQWAWETLRGRVSSDLNIPFAVRFGAAPRRTEIPAEIPAEIQALRALVGSLRELERRHEALRTRLVAAQGDPATVLQAIDPPGRLETPLIDLGALAAIDGGAAEDELGRLATENALEAMDLAERPMFRARIVRLGDAAHTVLCNLGHLVGDGWSVEILRAELAALYSAYAALAAGESLRAAPALPEPPIQFADFAAWQRRIEAGEVAARQLDYWRRRLAAPPPPLLLPGDWPPAGRGTVQAAGGFAAPRTARLRELARAEGSTLPIVFLATFGLLLAAYSGETDLLIESKVLGRTREELAGVVGLFMGTLPHRLDLSRGPSFAEALRRTRDGVVEDYCNQDLPYPRLMRELFPARRYLSRLAFNMLTFPAPTRLEVLDRRQEVYSHRGRRPDQQAPKYDLMLLGHEDREQVRWVFVGTGLRFRGETVGAIAADFETLLAGALDEPGAPAARLLPAPRYEQARNPS